MSIITLLVTLVSVTAAEVSVTVTRVSDTLYAACYITKELSLISVRGIDRYVYLEGVILPSTVTDRWYMQRLPIIPPHGLIDNCKPHESSLPRSVCDHLYLTEFPTTRAAS